MLPKKSLQGGIIVMEDIDAMTTVVHKRSSTSDGSQGKILESQTIFNSKDTPLTLEYFLNVLQGTLTVDGTTFITSTNYIEKLDPAFYRDGRFDIKIEMKACDHSQFKQIYKKFFDRELPEQYLSLLPEFQITPATFISRLIQFILVEDVADDIILEPFIKVNTPP